MFRLLIARRITRLVRRTGIGNQTCPRIARQTSTRYSPLIVRLVFFAKVSPDRIVYARVSAYSTERGFCIYRTGRASFALLKNISALFTRFARRKR